MTDDQQSENLRPIPDGGLKDSMPGWLKRPPAWRNMPTAEQRHERTLPEPDTSEIDPRTLVDVSDLPQWLQTIAARGEASAIEPDDALEYAVGQVHAASRRAEPEVPGVQTEPAEEPGEADPPATEVKQEVGLLTDEPAASLPGTPGARRPGYLLWSLVACGVIMIALIVIILYLL